MAPSATITEQERKASVEEYYGRVLSTSKDLKTSACSASKKPHHLIIDAMKAGLPDGYSHIFRWYVFGPSGFWTMAPLRYAAKFDPFLSLDCARVEGVGAQSKERKGSNFAIWQP